MSSEAQCAIECVSLQCLIDKTVKTVNCEHSMFIF